MSEIQLGKNEGVVKTDTIKGGVKREQLKTEEQKSIFDAADIDKNGILDENEMQDFMQKLTDTAGNEKLSKREAGKFLKNENLKNIDKKELFNFVNEISQNSENISESKVIEQNGEKTILITYKDGSQETINPDKTSQIMTTDANKAVTTKFFDENKKLTKESIIQENGDSEITDIENGLPVKKSINNESGQTVIDYNGGKESKKTFTQSNGSLELNYDYVDGKPVLMKKTEDLGNDIIRTTDFSYNEDGTTTAVITEAGKTITQQLQGDKLLSEIVKEDGKETQVLYTEDGAKKELVTEGDNKTATIYNSDNQRLQQVKIKDGKQYAVEYDGEGNTKGIIVQNGESISQLAKKFGCTKQAIIDANQDLIKGKKGNEFFDVGQEIKIPKELEADDKSLQGRKSADEAKAEFARDAEIRRQKAEAAKQEKEYYQNLGVKSFNDKGKKVKAYGWGDKEFEVIGQMDYGRQLVKCGGKLYTRSHDGKILREDYLQAHKAFVSKPQEQRSNTVSGQKDVTYVKDNNGQVWYFDEKTGKAIVKGDYQRIVKQESAFVANQLHTAAKGLGTDEELLEQGVKNIYSRDILQGVNAELKTKDRDYAGDAQTMPVEALILDEMSHGAARPLFKTLINSGTMTVEEQAHTVKREMEYEVHGGILGYTSTSDLNEIMQLTSDRDVRLEIESQFKKDHPELAENEGSVVRSYIAGDGWNAQEVDQFDANWVKTGAYQEARYVYQTDENGNVVLDKNGQPVVELDEGDQKHRNGVIGRLVFDYQDKEALNKGLEVVNDNPDSFDYKYLDNKAGEEVAKDADGKYQSRFTNQDNIQRYLAGFHSDETGTVDAGNVSASNTLLFKGEKPARIQAEEALYNAQNGDYSSTFDSMEPETYSAIAELVASGDVKDVKNMTELYNKAYNSAASANDKTKIKANAMLSGQLADKFSDDEIADFCIELMHSIDDNRGRGGSTGFSAGYTNTADYQTEQLKAILQNNPQIMSAVKERVENEDFSYTTTIKTGGGSSTPLTTTDLTTNTTNTKDSYKQLLAETKNIVQEEVFYDADGNKITDPEQIKAIKSANMQSLEQMRQYVAELERDYKKGIDAEGALSGFVNNLSEYSGIGTDREDVATEYRNAKLMLSQFEAAAQGRLRDSQGNVISAQDLAQQMLDKQNALAETNSDYKQTIAYGKMGIVLAPVIAATTVASGGAAAAGWGTLGVAAAGGAAAGAATYGVNALEYNTSYTGNTAEAREQNLEDSIVNGAATGIGIGQMKYIGNMANNMGTAARTGIRLGTTIGADTTVGATAEYAATGDVSTRGTMSNMIMSGVGNVIGAKTLGKKQIAPTPHPSEGVHVSQEAPITSRNEIADAEAARNIDQKHLNANERRMVEEGLKDIPTPEELAAYHSEMEYKPVPEADRPAFEAHQKEVAADYAEAHELGNIIDASSAEALQRARNNMAAETPASAPKADAASAASNASKEALDKLNNEIKGLDGSISRLEKQISGAKKFGKDTSKLDAQLENLTQKRAGKAAELEQMKKPSAAPEVIAKPEEAAVKPSEAEPAVKPEEPVIKAEDTPEVKPAEKADLDPVSPVKSKEPAVEIKPETIVNDARSILENSIPAQHRNLWKSCQQRLETITAELSSFKGDIAAMSAKCKTLLADLKTIANSVTGSVKVQIEKLMTNLKTMYSKATSNVATKEYTLSPSQREKVMLKREAYHSEFDDISYLRSEYPQYSNLSDAELLNKFKLDENHAAFVTNRKDLFGGNKYIERAYWNDSPYEMTNNHSAWKMHLFSVDTQDYQQMAEVILPYLNKHKIAHKTLSSTISPELLANSSPKQAGKAFTIYPQSQEEMAKVAKDLDKLIREHNLTTGNSHITGDNQLGDSGRLFYRYEFPTGKLKDRIYKPGERAPYDGNRGEGKYLADDMTPADDPWLNFDPSNPKSKPGNNNASALAEPVAIPDWSNAPAGSKLPKNEPVIINGTETLNLYNYELDLSLPANRAKLNAMKDGDVITVGRGADESGIKIDGSNKYVSSEHLTIEKIGDKFVVTDMSTNGTEISRNSKLGYGTSASEISTSAVRTLTSEDRMAMNQIGNNINRANTLDALVKAQQWLDKMPECSQKTALQNQLNTKRAQLESVGGGAVNDDVEVLEVLKAVDDEVPETDMERYAYEKLQEDLKKESEELIKLKKEREEALEDLKLDVVENVIEVANDIRENFPGLQDTASGILEDLSNLVQGINENLLSFDNLEWAPLITDSNIGAPNVKAQVGGISEARLSSEVASIDSAAAMPSSKQNPVFTYAKGENIICYTYSVNGVKYKFIAPKNVTKEQLNNYVNIDRSKHRIHEIKTVNPALYDKLNEAGVVELVANGKLNWSILKHLSEHADLSPEIYSDLAKLRTGESIVPEFPAGTDLQTAFSQSKLGDAVEIGDKMFINDGNTLIEWNMTKAKYLELFPPVERFATVQGAIGDCYLVQSLGLSMHNPKARAEFLQSFTLQGDDVVVTIKSLQDYHGSKTFPNGEIKLPSGGKHLNGCKGLQMYEQTYGQCALRPIETPYPSATYLDDIMHRIEGGQAAQAMSDIYGQGSLNDAIGAGGSYVSSSFSSIPFLKDRKILLCNVSKQPDSKTKIFLFDKYFRDFPKKSIALRNPDINTTETLLTHAANNNDFLISFGTSRKSNAAAESTLLADYNLISSHAYSILGYNESTGMVKIANPHAYNAVTEIPLSTLHEHIAHLDFLKL